MFDFFDEQELIRPELDAAGAEILAAELFGVVGTARELGSQQDRNFRIDVSSNDAHVDGDPADAEGTSYLLKVDNPAFSDGELADQSAAMAHLAATGLRVPRPIPRRDGARRRHGDPDGGRPPVRMFTFVRGDSLVDAGRLSPAVVGELGRISGTVARGLADFRGDGLERTLQWDLRNAPRVIDLLIGNVTDVDKRALLAARSATASARLAAVAGSLRVQPIHGDVTDDNVVCGTRDDGTLFPDGVIDFGDLGMGWLVAELAVTVASLLHHDPSHPLAVLEAIRCFDETNPLTDAELTALWALVVLRGAVLVVSGEHQTRIDTDNTYAEERMHAEWQVFESAASVDFDLAEAVVRHALGRSAPSVAVDPPTSPMLEGLGIGDYAVLDFSVTSHCLDDGRWVEADAELAIAREALRGAAVAVAPYGQYRLTRSRPNLAREPETFALCMELFVAAGTEVLAPITVEILGREADTMTVAVGGGELTIGGVVPDRHVGERVNAGQVLGHVSRVGEAGDGAEGAIGRLRVQQRTRPGLHAPEFTAPAWAQGWSLLAPDPAPLLGLPPGIPEFDPVRETVRRGGVLAGAQERYYENPPQIERGWREFLIGTDGRAYLDMVNNVSGIGHAHPRLTRAVADQMALLNTNSRFLYRALADFSERLVDLAPDPSLDTVLLVNSGSEAVDLALRLARIHTGRATVFALREAYHGWTMAADAVTTSAYDNPAALASRPNWVRLAEVPNSYRGRHRGAGAGAAYLADFVRELDAAEGQDLAAFICEPVLGNAGGVLLPDGYLAGVYEAVHARGGLCIADEVQVGYGRLGAYFWGVEQQGVVPDIVTVAKAMGNVHPLGAVITTREIAESLAREGNFFSSAGGSPVSCVAGLAVLDVMRDEKLQENARRVGDHLIRRLGELGERHAIIGAVHGLGLYLGVELVNDRVTLEPARTHTATICERMLERGIIVQATSERQNVLKIKPPLCLSFDSADFFVDMLDAVLAENG